MKKTLCMIALGVGGTLLYQQAKKGNFKKIIKNMNQNKTKMLEDLQDIL